MKILRIRNWNTAHENSRSRACDTLHWVSIPNTFDTPGYIRMVAGRDGPAIFAAWCALVMLASRPKDKARRGELVDETGTPYTPEDIAGITRLPVKVIRACIERAASPSVGWLDTGLVPDTRVTPDRQSGDGQSDGRVTGGRRATDEGKEGGKGGKERREGEGEAATAARQAAVITAAEAWAGGDLLSGERDPIVRLLVDLENEPQVYIAGNLTSPANLVLPAIDEARRTGKPFKSGGAASKFLLTVVRDCVRRGRPPGDFGEAVTNGKPKPAGYTREELERLAGGAA